MKTVYRDSNTRGKNFWKLFRLSASCEPQLREKYVLYKNKNTKICCGFFDQLRYPGFLWAYQIIEFAEWLGAIRYTQYSKNNAKTTF